MHPLSCDVHGSLHGHLQAFEVPSHHASATLYLPSGHGMAKWFGQLLASVIPHHPAATLWQQQGRWFPVWGPSDDQDVRYWYHIQCSYALHCGNILFPRSLVTYSCLLWVHHSHSAQNSVLRGKKKAFNTCSSHIIAVSLFYGPVISMYVQPSAANSQDKNKLMSLFYSLVTPMLNPFIYTLRNKDMKGAMMRLLVSLYHQRRG